ncbi:unnamed protein product [Prunus brigantina]
MLPSLVELHLPSCSLPMLPLTVPSINFTSLSVDLSRNKFTSTIPTWLFNLTKLENLDLSHNSLTGKLPDSLGYLKSLRYLNLSINSLEGSIPKSIGNLTSLEEFDLAWNQMSGNKIGNVEVKEKDVEDVHSYLNIVLGVISFVNYAITGIRIPFIHLWKPCVHININKVLYVVNPPLIRDLNIVNICVYTYKDPIYYPNVPSYLNIVLDVFILVTYNITRLRMENRHACTFAISNKRFVNCIILVQFPSHCLSIALFLFNFQLTVCQLNYFLFLLGEPINQCPFHLMVTSFQMNSFNPFTDNNRRSYLTSLYNKFVASTKLHKLCDATYQCPFHLMVTSFQINSFNPFTDNNRRSYLTSLYNKFVVSNKLHKLPVNIYHKIYNLTYVHNFINVYHKDKIPNNTIYVFFLSLSLLLIGCGSGSGKEVLHFCSDALPFPLIATTPFPLVLGGGDLVVVSSTNTSSSLSSWSFFGSFSSSSMFSSTSSSSTFSSSSSSSSQSSHNVSKPLSFSSSSSSSSSSISFSSSASAISFLAKGLWFLNSYCINLEKLLQAIQSNSTCRSSLMIVLAAMHLVKSKEFRPLIISNNLDSANQSSALKPLSDALISLPEASTFMSLSIWFQGVFLGLAALLYPGFAHIPFLLNTKHTRLLWDVSLTSGADNQRNACGNQSTSVNGRVKASGFKWKYYNPCHFIGVNGTQNMLRSLGVEAYVSNCDSNTLYSVSKLVAVLLYKFSHNISIPFRTILHSKCSVTILSSIFPWHVRINLVCCSASIQLASLIILS